MKQMKLYYVLFFVACFTFIVNSCCPTCKECEPKPNTSSNQEPAEDTSMSGRKDVIALVVGMSDYQFFAPLNFPDDDADSIAKVLRSLHIDVIPCINKSKDELKKAFHQWASILKEYKVALFYYSGHGAEINGHNYLFPISTPKRFDIDLNEECLQLDSVLFAMNLANTRTNLVLLDACRDNPFPTKSLSASGLKEIRNLPFGTFIGFSSAPNSVSLDEGLTNSIYTEGILKYIRRPDLTIDQIFNNVKYYVSRSTKKGQLPWVNSSLDGDFYFNLVMKTDISNTLNTDNTISSAESIKNLFPAIPFGSSVQDVIAAEYGEQFRNHLKFKDLIQANECKYEEIRYYNQKLSKSSQFGKLNDFLKKQNLISKIDDSSFILYQFKDSKLFRIDLNMVITDLEFHARLLQSLKIDPEKYAGKFSNYNDDFFTVMSVIPEAGLSQIILGQKNGLTYCDNDWFSKVDTINLSHTYK